MSNLLVLPLYRLNVCVVWKKQGKSIIYMCVHLYIKMKSLSLFTFGMALMTPSVVAVDLCYDDGTATVPAFLVNQGVTCKTFGEGIESDLASEDWEDAMAKYNTGNTHNCKFRLCLLTEDQVTNMSQNRGSTVSASVAQQLLDDHTLQTSSHSNFIESMCCDC